MSTFPKKMLLATDGSPDAERAARMAVTLSNALDLELHVVCVGRMPSVYTGSETEFLDPELQDMLRERAKEDAQAKVEEVTESIREIGGKVAETHVAVGRPDTEIVHVAEDLGAGLIALGSRGLGPLKRAVMGSVSDSVVRHAHGSVLVVRGDRRESEYLPGRILLAVDGSEEAAAATRSAVEIANATGSELHILYALPIKVRLPYPHPAARERWETSLEQAKHRAREFVDEQAERIEAGGGRVKDAHLAFGKPDEEIVKLSEELEAGLTVTGSRGLTGVRRALMGSVSNSVVRHAHCPVLVVREERRQDSATQTGGEREKSSGR
jgi:nucleotide-binding universal stress UspA family protein